MSQGSYYGLPSQGCFSLSEEPEKVRPPTLLGFEHFDISTSHHPSLSGEEKWPRESYSEVLHCCEAEPRVELELNEKKTCPTLMEWYVSNKYCGWLMDHKETPPPPPLPVDTSSGHLAAPFFPGDSSLLVNRSDSVNDVLSLLPGGPQC